MNTSEIHLIPLTENTDLLSIPTYFTQSFFYAAWQKHIGRRIVQLGIKQKNTIIGYVHIVEYPLPFNKTYAYAPYGPVVLENADAVYAALQKNIHKHVRSNCIFVRIEVEEKNILAVASAMQQPLLCVQATAAMQPRAEWWLEIQKSDAELLKSMHEKTRYSIRLSEKRGVRTEIITTDFIQYFDDFYALIQETSARNNFEIHGRSYYEGVFTNLPIGSFLVIAYFDQLILAIDVIVVYSGVANYVFGATTHKEKERCASHGAQWHAVQHARLLGCTFYNFGGITSTHNLKLTWNGITAFKKKFGGFTVYHGKLYDIVLNRPWYIVYSVRKWIQMLIH